MDKYFQIMKTRNFLYLLTLTAWCLSFCYFASNSVADMTRDPHGKEGMCHFCHESEKVEKSKAGFRLSTEEATCLECHGKPGETHTACLEQMMPDVKIKKEMISYFIKHPDFSCHSCHNVMCQSDSRKELKLRNPHIQLDEKENIIEKACLFCHTNVPDYKHPSFKNVLMRYDVSYLCSLCHVMSTQKKGLGFGERMTEVMLRHKEKFEQAYDVSLPLGPNNTVICASCHNPHQQGVILGKGGYATTPGDHRLALEDPYQLCVACHSGKY
jgi:hypothetical protein